MSAVKPKQFLLFINDSSSWINCPVNNYRNSEASSMLAMGLTSPLLCLHPSPWTTGPAIPTGLLTLSCLRVSSLSNFLANIQVLQKWTLKICAVSSFERQHNAGVIVKGVTRARILGSGFIQHEASVSLDKWISLYLCKTLSKTAIIAKCLSHGRVVRINEIIHMKHVEHFPPQREQENSVSFLWLIVPDWLYFIFYTA